MSLKDIVLKLNDYKYAAATALTTYGLDNATTWYACEKLGIHCETRSIIIDDFLRHDPAQGLLTRYAIGGTVLLIGSKALDVAGNKAASYVSKKLSEKFPEKFSGKELKPNLGSIGLYAYALYIAPAVINNVSVILDK